MEWSIYYEQSKQPTIEEIEAYIHSELWQELNAYIQSTYSVKPQMSYSKCTAQPGWNIKYKKSGKSLCTLYPMDGFFIALVTIGNKETNEVESTLCSYSDFTQNLYKKTPFSCGGRWLMIKVTESTILDDVLNLISIRVKVK